MVLYFSFDTRAGAPSAAPISAAVVLPSVIVSASRTMPDAERRSVDMG